MNYQKIPNLYEFDQERKKYNTLVYSTHEIDYLRKLQWLCTEKVDGMNIRVIWDGYDISFAGRKETSKLPNYVQSLLKETFDDNMKTLIEQMFKEKEVIFFMECYGGRVQKGAYNINEERLIGFDINVDGKYLDRYDAFAIFHELELDVIPVVSVCDIHAASLIVMSGCASNLDETSGMEGLVCTPNVPLNDNNGNRIIVKIKP